MHDDSPRASLAYVQKLEVLFYETPSCSLLLLGASAGVARGGTVCVSVTIQCVGDVRNVQMTSACLAGSTISTPCDDFNFVL